MNSVNALKGLDDGVVNWKPGEQPEMCRVRRQDLRELLHHFRRLDAEVRQTPSPSSNVVGASFETVAEAYMLDEAKPSAGTHWTAADTRDAFLDGAKFGRMRAANEFLASIEDRREGKLATIVAPDNGTPNEVLSAVLECARAWVPEARIIGNVRAGDIARAIESLPAPETNVEEPAQYEYGVDFHSFSSDYYRPSSCLCCGYKRDNPVHSVPALTIPAPEAKSGDWTPPPASERLEGFECLALIPVRWERSFANPQTFQWGLIDYYLQIEGTAKGWAPLPSTSPPEAKREAP